jgi:MscS family membrane protein
MKVCPVETTGARPQRNVRERIMAASRSFKLIFILSVALGASSLSAQNTLSAQTALTQVLRSSPAKPVNGTTDPLGRDTPSNSVLGFLKAATAGDYSIAAQYLQMNPAHRQAEGEQTANKLKFVLDRVFVGNYSRFDQPDGIPQEGVPIGHQKLGTMSAGDVEVDLDLVRVSDPNAGKIWLVSAETLARLP